MAASFFNKQERAVLLERLEKLPPDRQARWGKMDAGQMVCHLRDAAELALGEQPHRPQGFRLMRTPLARWLALYVIPWRKGRERAPVEIDQEKKGTPPVDFAADMQDLRAALERLVAADPDFLADHPYFGRMSGADWGRMFWKHIDHHLRQFGL